MIRAFALALSLAACVSGGAGSPCTRHSDCRSGVCSIAGRCESAADAGVDAASDATTFPSLPVDAPPDGADAMVDAP